MVNNSFIFGAGWCSCYQSDHSLCVRAEWCVAAQTRLQLETLRHLFYFDLNHRLLFSPPSISVWVMIHLLLSFPSSCQSFSAQRSFFLIFPLQLLDFITLRYFDRASNAPTPRGRGRLCLLVVATNVNGGSAALTFWVLLMFTVQTTVMSLHSSVVQTGVQTWMKCYFKKYLVFLLEYRHISYDFVQFCV